MRQSGVERTRSLLRTESSSEQFEVVVQNTVSVVYCEDWCFSQLSLRPQNTIDWVASTATFVSHSSGGWKSMCPP